MAGSFMKRLQGFGLGVGLLSLPLALMANSDCVDAGLLSGALLQDFCFECLLPVRIAGIPSAPSPIPPAVTRQSACSCDGTSYGITIGSWHPVRLIEVVTTPGCSPLLGGMTLLPGLEGFQGTVGRGEPLGQGHAFFHVHSFPFPYGAWVDPFGATPCRATNDAAPAYFSELDPSWNLPGLAAMETPEALGLLTAEGVAACRADALASSAGQSLDALHWCAGSWGTLFPLGGALRATQGIDPALTSLSAIRHQAVLHRRGLGLQTVGDAALCGGIPSPILEKSHYRMSRLFPFPERPLNHVIGAPTLQWAGHPPGPGRPGQPTIYLLWRWEDCCLPLL